MLFKRSFLVFLATASLVISAAVAATLLPRYSQPIFYALECPNAQTGKYQMCCYELGAKPPHGCRLYRSKSSKNPCEYPEGKLCHPSQPPESPHSTTAELVPQVCGLDEGSDAELQRAMDGPDCCATETEYGTITDDNGRLCHDATRYAGPGCTDTTPKCAVECGVGGGC